MSTDYETNSMVSNDKIFYYRRYLDLPKVPIFYNLLEELVATVNFCIEMPCSATIILCPTYPIDESNKLHDSNCISLLLGCLIVYPISLVISFGTIFILFSLIILIIVINIIIWPFVYFYNLYTQTRVSDINILPIAIGVTTIDDPPIKKSSIVLGVPNTHATIAIDIPIKETSIVLGVPIEHV